MDKVILLEGADIVGLLGTLQDLDKRPSGLYKLRVCIEGDTVKFKGNESVWSPPLGTLDPECREAQRRQSQWHAVRTGMGDYVTGEVCSDCWTMLNDNDTYNPDELWDTDKGQKMQATLEEYEITTGHFCYGNGFDTRCFHNGEACEDDCTCQTTEFSSVACTVCGTTEGGHRYDVVMLERQQAKQELQQCSVCGNRTVWQRRGMCQRCYQNG
jgi:hypothetical protein